MYCERPYYFACTGQQIDSISGNVFPFLLVFMLLKIMEYEIKNIYLLLPRWMEYFKQQWSFTSSWFHFKQGSYTFSNHETPEIRRWTWRCGHSDTSQCVYSAQAWRTCWNQIITEHSCKWSEKTFWEESKQNKDWTQCSSAKAMLLKFKPGVVLPMFSI